MSNPQNRRGTRKAPPTNAWKEGQSGNPGGRPKGLGRYIRGRLGEDGKAIADFAMAILNYGADAEADAKMGFPVAFAEKKWASEFLRDTGFGKPAAAQDEAEKPPGEKPKAVDPRLLTDEQLDALDSIDALTEKPPADGVN